MQKTLTDTLAVGLMAKAPLGGRVKTRLAADIGDQNALALYVELLKRVHNEFTDQSQGESRLPYHCHWFIEPQDQIARCRAEYPGYRSYLPQSSGDLGQRMAAAFEVLFTDYKTAALIGADIPDVNTEHLGQISAALETHDAVFGPTADGGYYLIGLRRMYPELFRDVRWSAATTLEETLRICKRSHISYTLLEPLGDLDTVADFANIRWRPESPQLRDLF